MKALAEVNEDIKRLLETDRKQLKRTQVGKVLNRLEFLNIIKGYLMTSPTEEFIVSEIARIENKINATMALFDDKLYKDPKPAKHKFERENKIPHLRDQIRALRFILN